VALDIDGDALTYDWDFGDGTTGINSRPGKIYLNPGTYTVSVHISDGVGGDLYGQIQFSVTILPLIVSKMQVKLNFAKRDSDQVQIAGIMTVENVLTYDGETVDLIVGGIQRQFTLNEKGKGIGPTKYDTFTIAKAKGTNAAFAVKLQKGNFAESLAAAGYLNADLKGAKINVPVRLIWYFRGYEKVQAQTWTSKKNKAGASK
jgi:hypothetical protein